MTFAVNEFAYTYDVAGNITQKVADDWTATTTNYTYNAANQMSQYQQVGSGAINPTYDAAGRMTSGINGHTYSYTWDRAGRLLTATEQAVVSTNTYNGLGQKLGTSHNAPSSTTTYWLDVARGLHQIIGATKDGATTAIVHGPMGVQGQETGTGSWLWPIQDGLGSMRRTIESDLDIWNRLDYRPYGDIWAGATSPTVPLFTFTGEPLSDDGLLYLRARHYNSFMGVFPSLDPLEGSPMQPQSLNRYAYVQGNSVNRVDSSGLIGELPEIGCSNSPYLQGSAPCSTLVNLLYDPNLSATHYTGDELKDKWIVDNSLCIPNPRITATSPPPYPNGYVLNTNSVVIAAAIAQNYGYTLYNSNSWTLLELARVARGSWLIARALETVGSGRTGEAIMQNEFAGTGVYNTANEICNLNDPNNDTACVPPVGILDYDGTKVYLPPQRAMTTFIHEIGHLFDFVNGSSYESNTLDNPLNPSTALYIQTGGSYRGVCSLIAGAIETASIGILPFSQAYVLGKAIDALGAGGTIGDIGELLSLIGEFPQQAWGACMASQLVTDYTPGGQPTTQYASTNHFEDFADSWLAWVMTNSAGFHNVTLNNTNTRVARVALMNSVVASSI